MSSSRVLILAIFTIPTSTIAFAGTTRDDRDPQVYLDLANLYPSVGRFDTVTASGNFVGSGTLVASDWVLTAAHLTDNVSSMTFNIGGNSYAAASWVPYSTWSGNSAAGNDLALVKLSAPVTNIAPAQRYTGSDELGKTATFVGYGRTGTGLTGATTAVDGQKRAGQNVLDTYYTANGNTNTNLLLSDFDNPAGTESHFGSASPLDLEYLTAHGDSGGGAFIILDGASYLAGVNDFGGAWDGNSNSDYGDASAITRVSPFNDWINSIITSDPLSTFSNTTSVPEPTTLSLLALASLPLLTRRRK